MEKATPSPTGNGRNRLLPWQLPLLVVVVAVACIIVGRQKPAPYRHESGTAFGTVYSVTYQSDSSLTACIREQLARVDSSLSMFNEASTISAINRNEPVRVDTMFAEVFALAQDVSQATDGAFDITVAPLVNAWGFGFSNDTEPSPEAIDSLLQFVGHGLVEMRGGRVVKADPRTMLDCSGIAKGYAADAVARVMRSHGVENFMVEIGGEIVTKGINESRVPWKIGVTRPVDDTLASGTDIQAVVNVTDMAMATSGNYRNFYYRDGKKYAHTIDPHTGRPVQHSLLSATVLADDCATADAYATAFMVMGMEKAKKTLESHPELMAYFIYADSNGNYGEWASPSMSDKIAH